MITGTLKTWNTDKGYGFISVTNDSRDTFVHISAFPNYPRAPKVGDRVQFEKQISDGKVRAVNCRIDGLTPTLDLVPKDVPSRREPKRSTTNPYSQPRKPQRAASPVRRKSGLGGKLKVAAVLAMIGVSVSTYFKHQQQGSFQESNTREANLPAEFNTLDTSKFRCDGRQYCSQMSSYEEALFFLNSCPDVKMDGDGDGIPCESQFGRSR